MPSWIDEIVAAPVRTYAPEPEPEPVREFLDPIERGREGRFFASVRPWIALGANVAPLREETKKPAIEGWGSKPSKRGVWLARDWGLRPNGHSLAVEDSPKIPGWVYQEWQARYREHNALIFPATLGCTVIDVDDITLLSRVLEACGPTPYRTLSGRADGGVHLWYAGTNRSRNKVVPGVDVKSLGGYVVTPGSKHAVTGFEYGASDALCAVLRGQAPFDPPKLHADWRARLQNAASGLQRPTRLDLHSLADSLKANKRKREIGKRLELVARGEVFAADGEKDSDLFRILAELAHWWPNAETDSIVDLFAASAKHMDAGCVIPIGEAIVDKWERLTANRAEQLDVAAQREEDLRHVAWGLVGLDRSDMGDPFEAPIVVHKGRTYYVRIDDHWYGPVTREDLSPDMLRSLRSLYGIDSADFGALMTSYGQPLREIRHSYNVPDTVLERGALIIAAGPRARDLTPEYSETVARGIELVCGQYAEQARLWIAGLTRHDRPCRTLVLSGARGVGKTLLLEGFGRLWKHGAAQLRHVLGVRFNDQLLETPYVIADDEADGSALAKYLRQAVSDRKQKVERKHQDVHTLDGAVRFAIGTNDVMEMARGALSHELNDEGVQAFADRLLHIPVNAAARGWWRHGMLDNETEDERTERLVAGGEVARHALWLAQQGPYQTPQDRFWVGHADQSLQVMLRLSTGLRGEILLRLAENEVPGVELDAPGGIYVVTPSVFVDGWQIDRPRGLRKSTGGKAIKALAECDPVPQPVSGARRRVGISKRLVDWYAEHCGL
ncbi:MAG: bifunctional DNA primase/polymerase [Planctomycetota bacterium]|nr:bifunctional DNA primase/polymerase [Planctomycetota bacterium]